MDEGGHRFITSETLSVQDRDSPVKSIGFVIIAQPEWGYLQHSTGGDNSPPSGIPAPLPSFTFHDIQQLRIMYVQSRHKNVEPIADKIVLYATDGKQVSDNYTLSIRITPVSDEVRLQKVSL